MITKTDFLEYFNAPRHLWALKHNQFNQVLSEFDEHLIHQGYLVEEIAVEYAIKYILPKYSTNRKDILIQRTINNESFQARTDILIRNEKTDKWDLYEIKSANTLEKEHFFDVAFQRIVLKEQFKMDRFFILHTNEEYVRENSFELGEFLTILEVTDTVQELEEETKTIMEACRQLEDINNYQLAEPCHKPKKCPCIDLCHSNLPEYSIYDLSRITNKKAQILRDEEILEIRDIPDEFKLSDNQRVQVRVAKEGKPYISKPLISEELSQLEFPLYFLDYETANPAIPLYKGYKPYQHMVFQYSLHILREPTLNPEHVEFLVLNKEETSSQLIEELQKEIGDKGTIIVWHKPFEAYRNTEMAELNPQKKDFILNLNNRIYDLMNIFRNNYYVHPKFKGSNSIKDVLPVIAPELSYKNLEVQNGTSAMLNWHNMIYECPSLEEKDTIAKNLLKYCELDTYSMFLIWKHLNEIIQ